MEAPRYCANTALVALIRDSARNRLGRATMAGMPTMTFAPVITYATTPSAGVQPAAVPLLLARTMTITYTTLHADEFDLGASSAIDLDFSGVAGGVKFLAISNDGPAAVTISINSDPGVEYGANSVYTYGSPTSQITGPLTARVSTVDGTHMRYWIFS